jgi:hypothetical protein
MKKSIRRATEKRERRKKRQEDENFWKIMYLTTDDKDDIPSVRGRKLPIIPFKSSPSAPTNFIRKVFTKKRLLIGAGATAVALLAYFKFQDYFGNNNPLIPTFVEYIKSQITIPTQITNLFTPFDGTTEQSQKEQLKEQLEQEQLEEIDKLSKKFETSDDPIIQEWKSIEFSPEIFNKDYKSIINYYSAFKIVNATINDYKISEKLSKDLQLVEKNENTIDTVCDFLNKIREQLNLKYDCIDDLKLDKLDTNKNKKSIASTIYLGYIESESNFSSKEFVIKYDDKIKVNIKVILNEKPEEKRFIVYLQNVFERKNKPSNSNSTTNSTNNSTSTSTK